MGMWREGEGEREGHHGSGKGKHGDQLSFSSRIQRTCDNSPIIFMPRKSSRCLMYSLLFFALKLFTGAL